MARTATRIPDAPNGDMPLSFAAAARDRAALKMVERALQTDTVRLAFQPVVHSSRQQVPVFYEALVRIINEAGRVIPAGEFMWAIESHELGRRMDCRALELGFAALAADPDLRLAINLSARSIGCRRWMRTLEEGISTTPAIRGRLILEITEQSAMAAPDVVRAFMERQQGRGVMFALDDFGAGCTSFRYLKVLPFDIIKIDGQFIREIHDDPDNQVLVQALVEIGRHFEMTTVAEAVETPREAAFLSAAGLDCLQGHLFGTPALQPVCEMQVAEKTPA